MTQHDYNIFHSSDEGGEQDARKPNGDAQRLRQS